MSDELIYEIIDASNEEMYYTIGLFKSLDEAISIIERDGINLISECLDDVALIEVKERKVGTVNWSGVGKKVYERNYTQNYDTDEWDVTLTLDTRTEPTQAKGEG